MFILSCEGGVTGWSVLCGRQGGRDRRLRDGPRQRNTEDCDLSRSACAFCASQTLCRLAMMYTTCRYGARVESRSGGNENRPHSRAARRPPLLQTVRAYFCASCALFVASCLSPFVSPHSLLPPPDPNHQSVFPRLGVYCIEESNLFVLSRRAARTLRRPLAQPGRVCACEKQTHNSSPAALKANRSGGGPQLKESVQF